MKRVFLKSIAVALILTAATTVNAQPRKAGGAEGGNRPQMEKPAMPKEIKTPEQQATALTEKMSEKMNLTEAQVKKLYNVNLDYINKVLESKKLESMHSLDVLDILNEDQSIQYLDQLERSRKMQQNRGGNNKMDNKRGGRGPQMMGQKRPQNMGPRPQGRPQGRPQAPECDDETKAEEATK